MSDGLRVLIVDDELPVRRFLRHAVEGQGWRVLEAEKGSEALSLAAQYVPDVILLDLGLPDQDGVDVCRALRTWFRGPILVISARGEEGAKVRARGAAPHRHRVPSAERARALRGQGGDPAPDDA